MVVSRTEKARVTKARRGLRSAGVDRGLLRAGVFAANLAERRRAGV